MAFSLADFGLVSSGMNRSFDQRAAREDAERKRKQQEEDRAYELERRKRAEEDEARTRAYAEELRQTLPKYLAGGEQARPAQAAVAGEVLDPFAVDGGEVARTAQPARAAGDNTEGLYEALKGVAAKYGRLDHYEAMKDRIKKATDEGVLDFIKKARVGTPEPELLESFNKSGKVKLRGLRRAGDDEFMAVTEDGQPVRLNLTSLTESLLAPKDLLAHQDKGAERERKASDAERRATYQGQVLDSKRQALEARSGLVTAQEELARARADRVRNPVVKPPKPTDFGKIDNEITKALKPEYTTQKDGGPKVDYAGFSAHKSMVSALVRQDPEKWKDDLPGAIREAGKVIDEAREVAKKQAEEEAKGIENQRRRTLLPDRSFKDASGGKATTKKKFVEQRTNELLEQKLGGKRATPSAKPAASVPQVKTDADYNALPSGAIFIDPDGNRRQKP